MRYLFVLLKDLGYLWIEARIWSVKSQCSEVTDKLHQWRFSYSNFILLFVEESEDLLEFIPLFELFSCSQVEDLVSIRFPSDNTDAQPTFIKCDMNADKMIVAFVSLMGKGVTTGLKKHHTPTIWFSVSSQMLRIFALDILTKAMPFASFQHWQINFCRMPAHWHFWGGSYGWFLIVNFHLDATDGSGNYKGS